MRGLVLLLYASLGTSTLAQTLCARGLTRVLSTDCASGCAAADTALCIAYYSTEAATICSNPDALGCPLVTTNACAYQCFTQASDVSNLTFSVAESTAMGQSDTHLDAIAPLALPIHITTLSILGGGTLDLPKGQGSNVSLTTNVLFQPGSSTALTNMTLANLKFDDLLSFANAPSSLLSLRVSNCRLGTAPLNASSLSSLQKLDLSFNRLIRYLNDQSLESLLRLNLRGNSLTSFEAAFPRLEELDLGDNKLTAIPSNLYLFSNLKKLNLSGNPLSGSTISPANYDVLSKLTELNLDGFASPDVCTEANEKLLKTYRVCVVDTTQVTVLKNSSLTSIIIVVVVLTAGVSLAGFMFWYYRRKKRNNQNTNTSSSKNNTQNDSDEDSDLVTNFLRPSDTQLAARISQSPAGRGSLWNDEDLLACQVRFEDIEDVRLLGTGGHAVVWLVLYRQTRYLASKRLIKDQITRQKTQEFVTEAKLLARLEHPSIVQFIGVAWTIETDLQVLSEYMPNGDLRDYLQKNKSSKQWTDHKVRMALDIVEALVYLHSFFPPLVHRDLKSRNVLLDENMKAKLSDFGVSRFQSENATMTGGVGTSKWLAPEVITGESDYDQSCDIYSFGVVLAELDTHDLPYAELDLAEVAILQMVASGSIRPRFLETCPAEIRDVATRCLAADPKQRPNAMEIAYILRMYEKSLLPEDSEEDLSA
ncbi:hypothetical protein Poli38472_001611 [Pythium oligandrum]|uniref:Protein kinase domain-containing protein n=1 Tax=Pythium oligandrum TaxID=41045 RepID=A0A8K1CVI4_PYTOL|nr:hypothetical protein Poli38472_001611 [Pythium oligandrum]|eukprot:TMW69455.1 hypothetical protein Poli38472_001611 [Pythium oligandrum]